MSIDDMHVSSPPLASRQQQGLSLIEMIMFIVIVAGGLLGLLSVFNSAVLRSADPMVQKQMLAIAESMLEEVSLKDFAIVGTAPTSHACDPDYRTGRAAYDDIRDYNGITNCPIYSLSDNQPVVALAGYSVTIDVVIDHAAATTLNGLPDGAVAKISVKVTHGTESITLDGYRTNYGP